MKYYDPWAHALQIFLSRLLLFVALDALAFVVTWWHVLDSIYGATARTFLTSVWGILLGTLPTYLQVMFVLTVSTTTMTVCIVFVFLVRSSRMRLSDRYRRGARVVDGGNGSR